MTRYQTRVDALRDREETAYRYHDVLIAVAEAQGAEGIFDLDVAKALTRGGTPTPSAWADREEEYRHETAGFVQAQRDLVRDPRARDLVYLGMTSSNLIDCADALAWQTVVGMIQEQALGAVQEAWGYRDAPEWRMGRTHGREAEPVPVGRVYARFAQDLTDALRRLGGERLLGSLAGPVGNGNPALTHQVVQRVEERLGIGIDPWATQTSSRHTLGVAAANLYHVIGACEQIATHHRLEAISGVDGFAEEFVRGQRGSSVMPHKRNPMVSERICGLSRVARGHLGAVLETANTQWWERDLTNSSVERESFWTLASLTLYILEQTTQVLQTGQVTADLVPEGESPSDELIRRVIEGESHDATYREIQIRSIRDA